MTLDWTRWAPMAERQRPYIRSHPLAYWFGLGVGLTGLLSLLGFTQQPSNEVLPGWVQTSFQVVWMIGGAASFYGIASGKSRYEAAGMVLIATGLLTIMATTLYLDATWSRAAGLTFIFTLAVACALRAVHLSGGATYPPVIVAEQAAELARHARNGKS